MVHVGSYVKVYANDNSNIMAILAKGFVRSMGAGQITIETKGGSERFHLSTVCLERCGDINNHEYGFANISRMPQIRNKATGNGFTRKGGKVRFAKSGTYWDSSRDDWGSRQLKRSS